MPGYILHLTAAKILLDKFELSVDKNNFYIGNLLPDTAKDKTFSHFWTEEQSQKMVRSPKLDLFLKKYKKILNDSSVLGYFYHLYIDWKFTTEYYPKVLKYLNSEMQEETQSDKVEWAYICKTKETLPVRKFLSDEYYYGDFTRMNTWLVENYQLPKRLDIEVENPGIEEVDYPEIEKILEQLKGYLDVSFNAAENLKVFQLEDLLKFLEESAVDWISDYGIILK